MAHTEPGPPSPEPTPSRSMSRRRLLTIIGSASLVVGLILLAVEWFIEQQTVFEVGLMCVGLGVIWLLCARFTSRDPIRNADKRYVREFFPAMAAYVLVMVLVFPLAGHTESPLLGALIALAPVLPVLLVARAMVRRMLAGDELERRMHLEATAIASLVVGMLSLSTGFLQASGLLKFEAGLIWVLPTMIAVWGLALWWAKRRYRAE